MLDTSDIIEMRHTGTVRHFDVAALTSYTTQARFGGCACVSQPAQLAEAGFCVSSEAFMFYVYILVRPNGKPFYIGKGKNDRVFYHEQEARSGHKCHKCNVIRKIWRNGGEVQRYTVFTTDDEQEAFEYEKELITLYGRSNLCNQTDGGEGSSGYSETLRSKKRASIKKSWLDPERKSAQTAHMRRQWQNPEARAARIENAKRRYQDPEVKAQRSAAQKKRRANEGPEASDKQRAILKNPEVRAKISTGLRRRYQDPEARAKTGAAVRAAWERKRQQQKE